MENNPIHLFNTAKQVEILKNIEDEGEKRLYLRAYKQAFEQLSEEDKQKAKNDFTNFKNTINEQINLILGEKEKIKN